MPMKTPTEQLRITDESMGRQLINESTSVSGRQLIALLLYCLNSLKIGRSVYESVNQLKQTLTTLLGLTSADAISTLLFLAPGTTSESVSPSKEKSSPEASPPPNLSSESEKWSCACGDRPPQEGCSGTWTPTMSSSSQTSIACMGCGSWRPRNTTNLIGYGVCEPCLVTLLTSLTTDAPNQFRHLLKHSGQTLLRTSIVWKDDTAKQLQQASATQTSSTQPSMPSETYPEGSSGYLSHLHKTQCCRK